MGKTSNRVKNYVSTKGKIKKMPLMDIYYKTVELRTALCDVARGHKTWGKEWYGFVEMSCFKDAKFAVITHGKGEMVNCACAMIDELADLEAAMRELEGGEK